VFAAVNLNSLSISGIRLVGMNAETGKKLLITIAFVGIILVAGWVLSWLARMGTRASERIGFWVRQGIHLTLAVILIAGVLAIWFNDPGRLATAASWFSAGLAFALQKVVTAVAGYFVILRGKTFNVGDRIVMGGVRGDVIGLSFTQTTIMEMGQPPPVQAAEPAMWVHARQYTGRVVTVTNSKIFDEPIYNYTRDFPYIWEEIRLPVSYTADRKRAEEILMDVGRRHTLSYTQLSEDALREMQRRYFVKPVEIGPKVYFRLTDNWLELTLRFVVEDRGIREVKDKMSREILSALDQAQIGIASATFEVVGLPPLRIDNAKVELAQPIPENGWRTGEGHQAA
jgi:small-conductance mechanosensitive channel